MIRVEKLCKSYGETYVLQDVSFSLEQGEVLGLFGPNGSGKSTLLNILALIARPDSGQYYIDTADALQNVQTVRPIIGYVPQDIALFEELTVRDNLLCWSRRPDREAKKSAEKIAQELSLSEIYGKRIKQLSGGMKRRVNLAVALLNNPLLLIMDEPLAGVDTEYTALIARYLRAKAEEGVTQIISSHSNEQLRGLMNKVLLLREGQVEFFGDAKDYHPLLCGWDSGEAVGHK